MKDILNRDQNASRGDRAWLWTPLNANTHDFEKTSSSGGDFLKFGLFHL
jgi:hypothetical protein